MSMDDYEAELRQLCSVEPMTRSLTDFLRHITMLVHEEQEKPSPDTALIAVLCDAARLGWEYGRWAKSGGTEKPIAEPEPWCDCGQCRWCSDEAKRAAVTHTAALAGSDDE